MKHGIITALAATSVLLASCSISLTNRQLEGRGAMVEKDTTVGNFHGIDAQQAIGVVFVQRAGRPDLHIETHENVMPHLKIDVKDGVLRLRYDESVNSVNNARTTVTVYAPVLDQIEVSSAACVRADSLTVAGDLEIEASSAASVKARCFAAGTVKAEASSAAHIRLSGSCRAVDFDASSAAGIDAGEMKAEKGRAEASSAAHVKVCVSGELEAESGSAGSVTNVGR